MKPSVLERVSAAHPGWRPGLGAMAVPPLEVPPSAGRRYNVMNLKSKPGRDKAEKAVNRG
jgi:hypothetical protein